MTRIGVQTKDSLTCGVQVVWLSACGLHADVLSVWGLIRHRVPCSWFLVSMTLVTSTRTDITHCRYSLAAAVGQF